MTNIDYQKVATNIINRLGDVHRLRVVSEATDLFQVQEDCGGISFKFKGSRKTNHVKIVLNDTDTYTVTFYKNSARKFNKVSVYEFVSANRLANLFEKETGLSLFL